MKKHFMLCIDNRGYEASLEIRKVYEVLSDTVAETHHQIRVIDESGEDYLYPARRLFCSFTTAPCHETKFGTDNGLASH